MTAQADIVQRDDGQFSLGWCDDAPGPFESRGHALAVMRRHFARFTQNSKTTSDEVRNARAA
jgi:hypothetical protein